VFSLVCRAAAAIEAVGLTKRYGAVAAVDDLEPLITLIDDWLIKVGILGAAATLGGASPDEISWSTALLVLSLWAVVFVAAGLAFERRRDVD
jgi:hypothetical protein